MLNCVLLIRFSGLLLPMFPKIFFHSLLSVRWLVGQLVPFLSSGPEEVDDLCFHTWGFFLVACTRLQPALSVGRSVCPSVTLSFFWRLRAVWGLLRLPNCLVNFITAPAHPHATRVAVYPALFMNLLALLSDSIKRLCPSVGQSVGPLVGPSVGNT